MKINMPVTDNEILMKKGTILVTRTDLKGRITYVNDAFVEISGYSREELMGANHNIVRHPDMPAVAFADLWETVKQGKPWTAPVKNRTKHGDYYWVEANVTPTYKDGEIIGYLSARYAPSREQIDSASKLYQQLNDTRATTIRPTGFAKMFYKAKYASLRLKNVLMTTGFLLPLLYLMYELFQQGNTFALLLVAISALFSCFMSAHINKSLDDSLERAIGICYRISCKAFRNRLDIDRPDKVGDLNRSIFAMQVQLNADLSYSQEEGARTLRIKQALDNVQSSVMIANTNLEIIYMNNTVQAMFKTAEPDIRKQLPNFDSSKLLGANIDIFHKNPQHQRHLLANLNTSFSSKLVIGGRHLDIVANPVLNDQRERVGIVVEWLDRTHEVQIENEIATLVNAVKAGDLSNRIDMRDKSGFYATLSEGINEMSDVIDRGFNDVVEVMQAMAAGDLTKSITNDYQGVYATCKESINETTAKLSEVFGKISEAADFINNSSQEIASGNNNLSQRAEEQASSLEETASSMEELTATVKNNADSAQRANHVANNARTLAEKGGAVVDSAVSAMQEINESSNKIAAIIGVIDEIAFQTNLLALNASVEAARAGEQGRGFSVVATEVRNLAQRSATAARQSKELIQTSVQKVRSGTAFVNETGTALNEIVQSIKQVGDIVAEIALASAEQSAGIEQVNMAVSQMDEITQQNAALAEEASAASVSMSEQSASMASLLSFFTVDGFTKRAVTNTPQTHNRPSVIKSPVRTVKPSSPKSVPVFNSVTQAGDDDDQWDEF